MATNYTVKLDTASPVGDSGIDEAMLKDYEDFIAALTGLNESEDDTKVENEPYDQADFQDDMLQAVIDLCSANARLSVLLERLFEEIEG